MDFTIYSIGNGAYLQQVLMAVVSFTSDGSFKTFVSTGMLLGVLIFAFQAVFNGGSKLEIGQLIVAFLIYAIMFGPKVDVAIEGLYDGYHGAVADVPLGIGAPGSIVSQLGYGITSKIETAFSGPGSTRPLTAGGSFADSLQLLTDIRRKTGKSSVFGAINDIKPGGADFRSSWSNYFRECTAIKVDLNEATIDDIYSADDAFSDEGIRFQSTIFGTTIYEGDGEKAYSCTEAYDKLLLWTEQATNGEDSSQDVYAELGKAIGIAPPNELPPGGDGGEFLPTDVTNTDPHNAVNNAMDALGVGAGEAQNYVRNAIIEPLFQEGMAGRYEDLRDFNTATMINSAIDQRNIQWASEQSTFMTIVHPMLTFIEGFAYSITPFMAFIIVLGGFGIKLAIKYGQMLLWIQLWLPVLAITNFFIYMVAKHDLGQLENFTTSFYAMHAADARLANWLSVGGMLMAATPVLTLVLLTGSTYAMTSLAQRMQGSDTVSEKQVSPDAVNPGAVMDQAAMNTNSEFGGRAATGAPASMGSLQLGQLSQSSVQSAKSEMSQKSNSFAGQFGQSYTSATSASEQSQHLEAMTDALSSDRTQGVSAIESSTDSLTDGFNLSQGQTEDAKSMIALSAATGSPVKLPASLSGDITSKSGESIQDALSYSKISSALSNSGFSDSDQAALTTSLASSVSDSDASTFSQVQTGQKGHSLSESAEEVTQASEQYQESQAYSTSAGMSQDIGLHEAGVMLTNGSDQGNAARAELDEFYQQHPEIAQIAQDRAEGWAKEASEGGKDLNLGVAQQAARLQAAQEMANYDGDTEAYRDGVNAVLGSVGTAYGINTNEVEDAGASQGTANKESMKAPGDPGAGAGAGKTPAQQSQVTGAGTPGQREEAVRERSSEDKAGVSQTANENNLERSQESVQQRSEGVEVHNSMGETLSLLGESMSELKNGAGAGVEIFDDESGTSPYYGGSSIAWTLNAPAQLEEVLGINSGRNSPGEAPLDTNGNLAIEALAAVGSGAATPEEALSNGATGMDWLTQENAIKAVSTSLGISEEESYDMLRGMAGESTQGEFGDMGSRMGTDYTNFDSGAREHVADTIEGAEGNHMTPGFSKVFAASMMEPGAEKSARIDEGTKMLVEESMQLEGVNDPGDLSDEARNIISGMLEEVQNSHNSTQALTIGRQHYDELQKINRTY